MNTYINRTLLKYIGEYIIFLYFEDTHFTLLVEKISIGTTGVSKESLKSQMCHPRLRLGQQLYAIWDILYFYSLDA